MFTVRQIEVHQPAFFPKVNYFSKKAIDTFCTNVVDFVYFDSLSEYSHWVLGNANMPVPLVSGWGVEYILKRT